MELILFIGLQATGKSTFYRGRFFGTHVRLNLDMLRTRHREAILFEACLAGKTPLVVDNTNLTRADRARYLPAARAAGFAVRGYFFQSHLADSLARNATREGAARVPDLAIRGSSRRLEPPTLDEGFDSLHFVRLDGQDRFLVEAWNPEV